MAEDGRVRGSMNYAGAKPLRTVRRAASKPNIDDVCLVFHTFREMISRAVRQHRPGSLEMVRDFDEARANLKARLTAIGLAEHIDWSDKS